MNPQVSSPMTSSPHAGDICLKVKVRYPVQLIYYAVNFSLGNNHVNKTSDRTCHQIFQVVEKKTLELIEDMQE